MIRHMLAIVCVLIATSLRADLYVYPAQNQSAEQQEKDKYDCYQFGKSQTGFDPMAPQTASTAPAPEKKGGALRGAAGGALVGAAVGAVAGDTGQGAAYGAAAGGAIGLVRKNKSQKEQQQVQQQQQQAAQTQRGNYDRAYAACLEGRGYTVK